MSAVRLPVVVPRLCKEDITGVGHTALVYRVQAHHCHVEEDLRSVTYQADIRIISMGNWPKDRFVSGIDCKLV